VAKIYCKLDNCLHKTCSTLHVASAFSSTTTKLMIVVINSVGISTIQQKNSVIADFDKLTKISLFLGLDKNEYVILQQWCCFESQKLGKKLLQNSTRLGRQ